MGKTGQTQRYLTTHDPRTGESIFETSISPAVPEIRVPGASMQTLYASQGLPHQLADNADLTSYKRYLAQPPGIVIGNGTVVRTLVFEPGASSHMHRTLSIDCGVVIDGQVKLELDSGETRLLQKGDVIVQRATMHAWHNPSPTKPCRTVFFIQPTEPLEVAGKTLAEEHQRPKEKI